MIKSIIHKVEKFYNRYDKLIRIIIAIVLMIYLFINIDLKKVVGSLANVNLLILIPLLGYFLVLSISVLKWKYVLEEEISFWKLLKIYWISNFFSNFLPSTIGGDSYKVIKLRDKGIKKVAESIVFDRFSGIISIFILSCLVSLPIYQKIQNIYFLLLPFLVLTGVVILFLIIDKLNLNIQHYKLIKVSFSKFKSKFLLLLFLSVISHILSAFAMWTYFLMFGFNINFLITLGIYTLVQIISMIPLSVNALGIREGAMVYLFSSISISPEVTLSIALLSRLVMLAQSSLGGVIYSIDK